MFLVSPACLLIDTGPSVGPLQYRQVHPGFAPRHRGLAARVGVRRVGPSQPPDLRPRQQPERRHRGGVCDQRWVSLWGGGCGSNKIFFF